MDISLTLGDADLSGSDLAILKSCLNVTRDEDLQPALQRLAKCAFLEYRKMFIEKGLPTKAAEVQQERLFYLIRHYFVDRLPTESEISNIFQLTSSGSKTLLKNTMSRNRTYLSSQVQTHRH